MKKKILAILLACVMAFSFITPLAVQTAANPSPCRASFGINDGLAILRNIISLPSNLNYCHAFTHGDRFVINDALAILRSIIGLPMGVDLICTRCEAFSTTTTPPPTPTPPTLPTTTPTTTPSEPTTTTPTGFVSFPTTTPTGITTVPTTTPTEITTIPTTTPSGFGTTTATTISGTSPTPGTTTPGTPAPPPPPPLPQGVLFDMQVFPGLEGLNTGNIDFLRRVANDAGAFEMTVNMGPPRTISVSGRTGSSQGIRVFAAEIAAVARPNHSYQIEFSGRFPTAPSATARIRMENPTEPGDPLATAPATNGAFTISATRTYAEIIAEGAAAREYSLGSSGSANEDITYTEIKITRICPTGCTACVVHGITIVDGGAGAGTTPASPVAGDEVTVRAGSRAGFIFNGWQVTAGGVTLADATRATTTFTMGSAAVTLTATWREDAGGSGIAASLSASDVVSRMGIGWNLGNQLDSLNGGTYANPFSARNYANLSLLQLETAWVGSANTVNQTLINNVKAAGFDTIRIPVTWYKAIEGTDNNRHRTNFTIRADWMARVREVVDWAYAAGFYVILNTHHDEYIMPFLTDADATATNATITRLWTLIAAEFNNDFGERLIFEVLNEPRNKGSAREWQAGTPEERTRLNAMNQAAVNAIRASGGNNANRVLMIPTYAASAHAASWGNAFDGFARPTDTAHPNVNKMILSVHSYQPEAWSGVQGAQGTPIAGTWNESSITNMMNGVQTQASRLGMPVVLGEWGSVARGEPNDANEGDNGPGSRGHHMRVYVREATMRGMATVMWDTGIGARLPGVVEGRFGLFDRGGNRNLVYTQAPTHLRAGYNEAGGLAGKVLGVSTVAHTSPISGMTITTTNTAAGVSRWSLETLLAA
ncbi:MAG: cellulase family glycosylhydrolase [Oscillospiraceae bacterium]|nr:cellulase family glycosylhydrolase [Oscillospiraceae bacterium]